MNIKLILTTALRDESGSHTIGQHVIVGDVDDFECVEYFLTEYAFEVERVIVHPVNAAMFALCLRNMQDMQEHRGVECYVQHNGTEWALPG